MLEDSKFSTRYFDAPTRNLIDFKTKGPLLRLGLNSYLQPVSSFELARDLEKCFNLYCETNSNEFKLDFTLPANRLKSFVSPIKKLKMLTEKIDFSEFLLFDSDSKKQLVLEQQNDASDNQNDSELYYKADIDQGYGELQKLVDAQNIVTKSVVQPSSGIFSGLLRKKSVSTRRMTKLFVDADRARIQQLSHNNTKSRLLSSYLKKVILDKQLDLNSILSVSALAIDIMPSYSGLPFPFQEKKINCQAIQSFVQNNIKASGSLKEKSYTNDNSPKNKDNIEVVGKKLISTKIAAKKTNENQFLNRISLSDIKRTSVRLFCMPTELFLFDNLKQWKKKGEGQIEIWRHRDSGNLYMLFWDNITGNLLVHMQLDGNWGIEFLANGTNCCRWVYNNYAKCPKGSRERLACHFKDSKAASKFMATVAYCMDQLLLK